MDSSIQIAIQEFWSCDQDYIATSTLSDPMHTRPGAKYMEKYSNTLQLLSLINDYNYITITGRVEM